MLNEISNQTPTMSSREIAEMVNTTHDSVLKTVRGLVDRGVVSGNETPYRHTQNGQWYPEFLLTFRDTMVVVSGYSPELRARIIDRWQQLEASARPAPIDASALLDNPAALRDLLLGYTAKVTELQAEVATLAPKGEAYDRFMNSQGLIGLQNVGRALHCHPNLFIKTLIPDYCFRDARGTVVARQVSVDRGLFFNKPYDAPNGKVYLRAYMTTKGLDHFSTRIPAEIRNRTHQTIPALSAAPTAH